MIFKYHNNFKDRVVIGKPLIALTSLIDLNGIEVIVNQPVIAIRHATMEEFHQYILDSGKKIASSNQPSKLINYRFLEVSTD